MMGKRRGTAQIATASPAGCAASNRHKNLLFSQLARSLAVYSRRNVSWAIDPVVVSSITQCFILVGFSALSRSVAEFITGVRYLYYAAISASRSHIRISLSRVSPEPRAFALLRLHLKDGAPKKLWLQPHSKRPAQQPPSHFGFLVALPLVRFKDPPSCALPPLLLHLTPSASATSSPHLANFLSSRRGSFTCDAPPSGLRDLLRFQYQLRR